MGGQQRITSHLWPHGAVAQDKVRQDREDRLTGGALEAPDGEPAQADPRVMRVARQAIRLALRLAAHPALQALLRDRVSPTDADLASDQALDDWLRQNIGTSHHVSGTCKMGPAADPMAVVDQYGRVHGLDNLRIADASIMPDCIRANTNATTIMIGERIADLMRQGR